jgi:hypothetical protein
MAISVAATIEVVMSKLRKKYLVLLAAWAVLQILALWVAVKYQGVYIALMFALPVIFGTWMVLLRCPNCGKAALHNPKNLFGTEIYLWTVTIPEKCTRCGYPL